MEELSSGALQGSVPVNLQLLVLQCLSAAFNKSNSAEGQDNSKGTVLKIIDDGNPDANDDDLIIHKLTHMEINLRQKILELLVALRQEIDKSSCKTHDLLPSLIEDVTNSSRKNQELLATSIEENNKLSNRNLELQAKLNNLTTDNMALHKALVEENHELSRRNQELQVMLANMTSRNQELNEQIISVSATNKDFDVEIKSLKDNKEQLSSKIKDKEGDKKELEETVGKMKQKMEEMTENLNNVAANHTNMLHDLGMTVEMQNYCKISSHSVLWKLSHKGSVTQIPAGAYIWKPTQSEIDSGKMEIKYSASRDLYVRATGKEEMQGWDKGIYQSTSFFRMVENDFKVAYLARNVGTPEGTISWKFSLSGTGTYVDEVRVLFGTALFENGKVEAQLCSSSQCIELPGGSQTLETSEFQGVSELEIKAKTTLGLAGAAWQHAQLFRQVLSDTTGFPFIVSVTLRRCDVLVM